MSGMHAELKVTRGIQVAPGDTGSAETGYTILDLLSGAAEGFALKSDLDGWDPALPAPKPGLWHDVPFVPGRTPFAGADMNVTETLRLTVTAATHLRMSELLHDLHDMIQNCERFWFDEFYCQPTFIHWWATGAPGRQYALIVQMDADISTPSVDDGVNVVRDVVLTIEREPYWRAEVPPGANPIYWTLFAQGKLPGANYDYLADLRIMALPASPLLYSLVSDVLENKLQYSNLTASANVLTAENRLTVPAASIPGDAPALLQLSLSRTSDQADSRNFLYMVSRSTRLRTRTARNSDLARFVTMIPFTAGSYGAPVLQTDTGGIGGYNTTTLTTIVNSRLAITPGASLLVAWFAATGLDKNLQRGRFAVFVRCRQNSGSSGDITLRVRAAYDSSGIVGASVVTDTVVAPLQAGTGNTTAWPVVYCGSFRLPLDRDESLSTAATVGGSGKFNATRDNLFILLEVARSTGTALLYFLDVQLLPYDEALLDTAFTAPVSTSVEVTGLVVDNTGYLTRGKPGQIVIGIPTLAAGAGAEPDAFQNAIEQRGAQMTLEPGVDNHIYVFERDSAGESQPSVETIQASANIVPRWRGIRSL